MGIVLPEDQASCLLGIYPKDALPYQKDMCSAMFIAALFIITRNCKQPRRPSTEEWIQIMVHYIMGYFSIIKFRDIMNFAVKWIELETIILSEVNPTHKGMHDMYLLISGY